MSELDFLLNRKKSTPPSSDSIEKKEEGRTEKEERRVESRQNELAEKGGEGREESLQREEKKVESAGNTEEGKLKSLREEGREESKGSSPGVEEMMSSFLDKDPKIGVWSYPAFMVLQYLYNTKPGFKMSRVAKEALEMGLRQLYPELFKIAEKVYREKVEK
ncbi:MAG: hypothetical protein MPF33_08335 [Candidatus Aramenus sp.]|nr:hypothetical protein [Candidatus Aramenus sp.]